MAIAIARSWFRMRSRTVLFRFASKADMSMPYCWASSQALRDAKGSEFSHARRMMPVYHILTWIQDDP